MANRKRREVAVIEAGPRLNDARNELVRSHGFTLREAVWFVGILNAPKCDNLARVALLGSVPPNLKPNKASEFLRRHGWL